MGIVERKEREKQELRELILKTAAKQFSELGFEKTSMRSIAREIEYSPTTIYLYFQDKSDLLYALSERAFAEFYHYLKQAFVEKEPMKRLYRMGKEYIRFGMENPEYYDLMFILKSPMESLHTQEGWDLGMSSHRLLSSTVQECKEQGYFLNKDVEVLTFMIWSFVHGMMVMHIRQRMRMYPEKYREHFIEEAHEIFGDFLEKDHA